MKRFNAYRNGRVHVCASMCATCIFRPGDKMHLSPGRLAEMVKEASAEESAIICHSTLGTKAQAVCRGFFDKHRTSALQIAERMGVIEFQRVK